MSQNEDIFAYDEDKAVEYIKNVLPQELKEKYSDDDIVYVTDVVYDYYEQKGLFNEDAGDDVTITREFYPYNGSAILSNDAVKTYTLDKNSRRFAQPILESEIETSQGAIQQNTY